MSTASRLLHIDRETRNAFNELLLMEQLSALPVGSMLRVLQTIPVAVLEAALSGASRSPCRDGTDFHANSHRPGSR